MNNTDPHPLTPADWREIGALPAVREHWHVGQHADFAEYAKTIYGVKFDFVSGSHGYVGELFILQDDALAPPLLLRRDDEGRLRFL